MRKAPPSQCVICTALRNTHVREEEAGEISVVSLTFHCRNVVFSCRRRRRRVRTPRRRRRRGRRRRKMSNLEAGSQPCHLKPARIEICDDTRSVQPSFFFSAGANSGESAVLCGVHSVSAYHPVTPPSFCMPDAEAIRPTSYSCCHLSSSEPIMQTHFSRAKIPPPGNSARSLSTYSSRRRIRKTPSFLLPRLFFSRLPPL